MKFNRRYPKKRIIATTISSYIMGWFATIWAVIMSKEINFWIKFIGVSMYAIAFLIHCFYSFKRWEYGIDGIIRVHKDDDYSDITKQFKKAKNTIEIIVYHGNNLLYYTKSEIINALKRDVDVKLLITEKDSVLLNEAEILEERDGKENQDRAWEIIEEIKREAKGKTCSIRCFTYHTQARYALIIVDGNWAWYYSRM